ncbi:hypothetical protein [Pedobacter sp. MW01-1-1]|uniref:hypothetical protein n=1 Tax=Pedobacter sp. MW01-1-1 TaxID=3383027 RepID=UPI003FEFF324
MKKAILTIVIAVMGFSAAFAQNGAKRKQLANLTAEQRAERATAGLDKQLSLSADQKTKVYAIQLERAKKMDAYKGEDKAALKENKKEIKALLEKSQSDLDAVLTPEQKTKYEAFKAEKKGEMKKGHGKDGKKAPAPVVSNPPAQS